MFARGVAVAALIALLCAPVAFATTGARTFTTPGEQQFVVPPGVSSLHVTLVGGRGGSSVSGVAGGSPSTVEATLAVAPGQALYVQVAGNGNASSVGGYGGGGAGGQLVVGFNQTSPSGGGGGGASDIRTCSAALAACQTLQTRLLVAAGGGGGGASGPGSAAGGAGGSGDTPPGGQPGQPGFPPDLFPGGPGGGYATANGGAALGNGGAGGGGLQNNTGGGGGGGGIYGGGGGAFSSGAGAGGGGGGSSGVPSGAAGVSDYQFVPTTNGAEPTASLTWTLPPPALTTAAATAVTYSGATVNGTVNPNGSQLTDCHFVISPAPPAGSNAPCAQQLATGGTPGPVSAMLAGLSPSTTYTATLNAASVAGATSGSSTVFTTLPVPPVVSKLHPPVVSKLQIASRVHRGSRKATILLTISQNAALSFTFERIQRVHRRTRYTPVAGKLTSSGRAGENRLRFSGVLDHGIRLALGRYRLTVVATNSAGERSVPQTAAFKLVQ